jgi:hypothetical protein
MQATINYLNCLITIDLPNPEEDNTVKVLIKRLPGSYNENLYNAYLKDFQFSGESEDPNDWILEALRHAIASVKYYVEPYAIFEPSAMAVDKDTEESEDYDSIPF